MFGGFGPPVSVCPQAHERDRREAQIQMQIPVSHTKERWCSGHCSSGASSPSLELSPSHSYSPLPQPCISPLTPTLIPTFIFSQSLAGLQQRLELACMCRAGQQSHSDGLRKASQAGQRAQSLRVLCELLSWLVKQAVRGKKNLCLCMWKSLQLPSRPSLLFRE